MMSRIWQCALISVVLLLFAATAKAEESIADSIDAILDNADTLYSRKDYEHARREYERAIAIDRGSIRAWEMLAWSLWALGEKEHAYQVWADLLKAFPDNKETLMNLGKASEQDHRWNRALDYYAQLSRYEPGNEAAHLGRARIFLAQRDYKAAEQEIRKVLKNAPLGVNAESLLADVLIGQRRYGDAEALLRPLTKTEPVPMNLRRLGMVLAELGRHEEAAAYFRRSLQIQADDESLTAWRGLGSILRRLGQNQRAYDSWRDLLKDFPDDLPTLLALGRASEQDQLWPQGLDYYAQVLRKAPEDEAAHLGRARILSAQGDYKPAEQEIRSVLARSPADAEARFALVENLVASGHREEAEALLPPLLQLEPVPKNLRRLGTVLAELGRNEEAAAYFRKSLQRQPDDAEAIQGLAHVYWNQHRYNESITLLERYLAAHPEDDRVRARLAEHDTAAGHWEKAQHGWEFLVQKHPEESLWKIRLAHLLHRAGHHEEAVQLAQQVLEKEPNNVNVLGLIADDAIYAGDIETGIRWAKRLTNLAPTPEGLTKLGKLHIELGGRLAKEGKQEGAAIQYGAAAQEFEHAAALDPIKSRAPVLIVEAKRLQGHTVEAIELAKQLHAKYPSSVDILQQLADAYWEQGNYPAAREMLELRKPS